MRDRLMAAVALAACGVGLALAQQQPRIAAGSSHTLALSSDGRMLGWGSDFAGQVGAGRLLSSRSFIRASGAGGYRAVAAGNAFSLALRTNGELYGWGSNAFGELGDDGPSDSAPRLLGRGYRSMAVGILHSVAVKDNGDLYAWGENSSGQVGDGTTIRRTSPTLIGGSYLSAAAHFHTVAVRSNGDLLAWGSNAFGQLGDGTTASSPSPRLIGTGYRAVAAGLSHTLALKENGDLYAWGDNTFGQLGDGTTTSRLAPVFIGSGYQVIAAGWFHSLAVHTSGELRGWGTDFAHQLGLGERLGCPSEEQQCARPQRIASGGFVAIAAGLDLSVAVTASGELHAWGANAGRYGDGSTTAATSPRLVGTGYQGASVGAAHVLAVRVDGGADASGENRYGQLGDGGLSRRSRPTSVGEGFRAISAGVDHSVAMTANGDVYAWGDNSSGELGDGTKVARAGPILVDRGYQAVAAGNRFTLGLKANGDLYAWGRNFFFTFGNGGNADRAVPTLVGNGYAAIAAGNNHGLGLRANGDLYAWGSNTSGQIGDGTSTNRSRPVLVGIGFQAMAAGSFFSLALKTNGELYAWGSNAYGQVGDGSATSRLTPTLIGTGFRAISAGQTHSVALKANGDLYSWGDNQYGQLGNGTRTQRLTPTLVGAGYQAIAAGWYHTVAVTVDGAVHAWGHGGSGQLGNGTLAQKSTRVAVMRNDTFGSLDGNDWFLDLDTATPSVLPADLAPTFLVSTTGPEIAASADIRYRSADIGRTGSVFVFALAPASVVSNPAPFDPGLPLMTARGGPKDTPAQCVLAQLNAAGQLVGVTAANLQAYITGVLSSQGQAVSILGTVPTASLGGAIFFVGYGSNGTAMINTGTNRGVLSVPGSVQCQPQAPQKGWWWNPAEDGRGFSIERRGNNLFFASFLYDVSGRSTWYVSTGPVSLDGSLYTGDLLSARGGQALGSAYPGFPTLRNEGLITLAFNSANEGLMIWPGGNVPIQRFNIVANGANAGPAANVPESGWWWNESEPGRGFFMEWQGSTLDIAGYMYDNAGNPVWYLTVGDMAANGSTFSGSWWSYGNGQTLTGAWKPNTRLSTTVAPLTITFSAPDTALMTLPNGRSTSLRRHRF